MKLSKLVLLMSAAASMSVQAMSLNEADVNVKIAQSDYDNALSDYNHAARLQSSGVNGSVAEKNMNAAATARAQALADQRTAYAASAREASVAIQKQADDKVAGQVLRENEAYAHGLRNMHPSQTTPDTLAPSTTKETNPLGHPTGQNMDSMTQKGNWNQQPGIVKESNVVGKPTNTQTGPVTHLDRSAKDAQAATVAAAAHLDAAHHVGHATASATPNVDRSAHLDTVQHYNSEPGAHLDSVHQQAPTGHIDAPASNSQDQLHAQDLANYGVKGNPSLTSQYHQPQTAVTYSGVSHRPNTGATINVSANSLPATTRVTLSSPGRAAQTVAASQLKPDTQVQVAFNSAFTHTAAQHTSRSHDRGAQRDQRSESGADNAHSHAFGGHGYGHDNSASEGFGGHSQFH